MKAFDVVGVGRAVVDFCVLVQEYPKVNEKTEALGRFYGAGSPVPNALCQLARWGHHVAFQGKIGQDVDGENFLNEVSQYGVDLKSILMLPNEKTPRAHIWVEKKSGKRTIVLDRTIAPLSFDELSFDQLHEAKYLLIDGYEADAALEAAKAVRSVGGEVVLDAGSVRDRMDEQLAASDWTLVPVSFVRSFYGSLDLFEAVRDLLKRGAKGAVVTNGSAGCVGAQRGGEAVFYPPYAIRDVVDTTGAGDLFHAGFLHGLLQGWPFEKTVAWAQACGALAVRKLGGQAGISDLTTVTNFLVNHGETAFEQ